MLNLGLCLCLRLGHRLRLTTLRCALLLLLLLGLQFLLHQLADFLLDFLALRWGHGL